MIRAAFWGVFAAALAMALAFRLAAPALRPLHHDEANQAIRFGTLLETGEYLYDRHDHHGPTLYYLTLPFAWMRGQRTLAALDERTLRLVPAVFGVATLLLFPLLTRGIGRVAVASAALLAAISPALTYYSRFYIQETIFVFFTLAFVIALGRYARHPGFAPAIWTGVLAGLAYATKETSIVVFPSAAAACVIAMSTAHDGRDPPRVDARTRALHAVAAFAAAALPAFVLFSGFLRNPRGMLDSLTAFTIYFQRGVDAGPHVHPFSFYLRALGWTSGEGVVFTEALVLVLAVVGLVHAIAVRKTSFWPLYIALYAVAMTVIFSAIRYKTPWNLLPFYIAIVLTAGVGAAAIVTRARPAALRAVVIVLIAAAAWQLGSQSVRANFRYPADPRNPYVYAHTSTDFLKLAARVHDLAPHHPDGRAMLIKVVAGPYEQWPFPWYARQFPHVGYWSRADEAGALDDAAVVVASEENAAAVEAALGDRYISEYYGLRPGVLLTLYIERGLWDRFLASRQ